MLYETFRKNLTKELLNDKTNQYYKKSIAKEMETMTENFNNWIRSYKQFKNKEIKPIVHMKACPDDVWNKFCEEFGIKTEDCGNFMRGMYCIGDYPIYIDNGEKNLSISDISFNINTDIKMSIKCNSSKMIVCSNIEEIKEKLRKYISMHKKIAEMCKHLKLDEDFT